MDQKYVLENETTGDIEGISTLEMCMHNLQAMKHQLETEGNEVGTFDQGKGIFYLKGDKSYSWHVRPFKDSDTKTFVLTCTQTRVSIEEGSYHRCRIKLEELARNLQKEGVDIRKCQEPDTWQAVSSKGFYTWRIQELPVEEPATKVEADASLPTTDSKEQMSPLTLANQLNHVWSLYHALDADMTKIKQENAMLREKLRTIADIVNH